jgi:hypothetical protein
LTSVKGFNTPIFDGIFDKFPYGISTYITLLVTAWVGFFNYEPFNYVVLILELLGVDALSLLGDLLLFP